MPELPEVETVRRQLQDAVAGQTIVSVDLYLAGREVPAGPLFVAGIIGKTVEAVDRRAKLLIWRFTDGSGFVAHLKMTGKFLLVPLDYSPTKHDRLKIITSNAGVIWNDVRKFGYVKAFASTAELNSLIATYGPEPLISSLKVLADRLLTPKTRTLKAALLDQTVIAGLGNIYADEVCHRAGLRPTRRLLTLTATHCLKLAEQIKHVLTASLALNGTTSNNYLDVNGERGGFVDFLQVYGRTGLPCHTCRTPIKKITLAGRGTHYCPSCQK
jgi:formamidopyrimidine-DNA glycosylase